MNERRFGGVVGRFHGAMLSVADRIGTPDSAVRKRFSSAYGDLLYALTLGRGVEAKLNGESFHVDPRLRWFLHPEYEAELAGYLRRKIPPGAVCLDIGAHIGVYAMQIARWIGPSGRVIAFEPNPGTAPILRRHLRMNDLGGIVRVEETALGRQSGTASLFGVPGSGLSRLGAPNPIAVDTLPASSVAVGTVDAYCAANRIDPDWILIDVEGLEFDVLSGAVETIRRRGSALSIVVEIHPTLWPLTPWTRDTVEALFRSIGRRAVSIVGQQDPLGDYGSISLEPVAES
ncbi:MAG: FkbM family methyltransferase [Acidobacteriota bacterium]